VRNKQTNKLRSAAKTNRPVPRKRVIPVDCPGREKYSTEPRLGMFSRASLTLPEEWAGSSMAKSILDSMVGNLQASVSIGSWSNYATAYKNLKRCSEDLKIQMDLPLSEIQVVLYVGYLLMVRKVKPETAEGYLSGLRMAHWAEGWPVPTLRAPLLNQVLKGAKNIRRLADTADGRPFRKAMTIPLMLLLKLRIAEAEWSLYKKVLVWAISVLAFFGSFRIGELLPKYVRQFDSRFTLLGKDVSTITLPTEKGAQMLVTRVHVKSPKVDRVGRGDEVEVFEMSDVRFCPIRSLRKYEAEMDKGDLADSGSNYTKDNFNADLKELLSGDLDYAVAGIWAHSFRAGISTHMARWGFVGDDIKGWGRWSSESYRRYIKLPTLARRRLAGKIQEKFEEAVGQLSRSSGGVGPTNI
jgi:hypothetical protein